MTSPLKRLFGLHRNLVIAAIILGIIGLLGLRLVVQDNAENKKAAYVNLISGYDWSDFAGSRRTPRGVVLNPVDRKIVHQDGSGGQLNPGVNLAGPELSFKGDFTLNVFMKGFQAGDSLRLYGGVPIVYDEWRYEPPSVELMPEDGSLQVSVSNGTSSDPAGTKRFRLMNSSITRIQIVRHGRQLAIAADGKRLGTVSPEAFLKTHKIWFGAAAGSNTWTLTGLSAQSSLHGALTVGSGLSWGGGGAPGPTLRGFAPRQKHRVHIGAAIALNPLLTDERYRNLALNQFDMWTTENDLKPQFVHPKPNTYSFQEADLLVDTALKNGIAVHGHTLVFGEANPRWMRLAPPATRKYIMENHIKRVMAHFRGRIHEWDVVNEPLSDNEADYANGGNGLRRHIWYQAMGSGYIDTALKTAHATDKSVKLYINDYGLEADGERWNAMVNLVTQLRTRNVPLGGIGFESHVYDDGDHIDPVTLKRHIRQLAKMGLVSRISEIDVHGENPQQQGQEYDGVLKACLSEPGCTAFSSWGITDKYGSTTDTGVYPLSYGNDLLWNTSLQPKPAFEQLLRTLQAAGPARSL
jgi:endo-1,4-beta-xylanase